MISVSDTFPSNNYSCKSNTDYYEQWRKTAEEDSRMTFTFYLLRYVGKGLDDLRRINIKKAFLQFSKISPGLNPQETKLC